ncbi:unnamed protein product [Penicillium olsonii]|uniref:Uncharacterized protein n=1 Tax=Penicillium olsonii TaxID=99116 RepID=A0A9W4HCU3_PENOL|nr:unnamed protein product [Penicillium olsonii]CAG7970386.1 unnamed protein product [Penicillium olsonii]CAG7974027.1 unnamed protein product [Penicillium olsonii]
MERKLSTATKIRNRFSFSRSSSVRDRTPKVSPVTETSSSSRPRSATTPESLTPSLMENQDIEPSRGYDFTDEEGFFRPETPLLGRQEIHEDLLADVKHACALLSHSIDRGIPAGLSYQSTVPNWTEKPRQSVVPNYTQTPRQSVVPEPAQTPRKSVMPNYTQTPRQSFVPNYTQTPRQSVPSYTQTPRQSVVPNYTQAQTSKSINVPDWVNTPNESTTSNWLGKPRTRLTGKRKPGTRRKVPVPSGSEQESIPVPPIPVNPEAGNDNKHDSGVGMSYDTQNQPDKPTATCHSGTVSPIRFYNKTSTSPPGSPPRSRSPKPEESFPPLPQEPSFQHAPSPISHSPPQSNDCPSDETHRSPVSPLNETDKAATATKPSIPHFPIQNKPLTPPEPTKAPQDPPKDPKTNKRSTRFYSTSNATTMAFDSREWLTRTFWEDPNPQHTPLPSSFAVPDPSRPSSRSRTTSRSRADSGTPRWGSVSTEDGNYNHIHSHNYPYGTWAARGMSYSSSCLADEFKHQENVYSCVVSSSSPPRGRRQKASMLFKKLAGLRIGRREEVEV